jgi:hypothetical protein
MVLVDVRSSVICTLVDIRSEKCWAIESNLQLMYLASYWIGYSSFQDGEFTIAAALSELMFIHFMWYFNWHITRG